MLSFSAFTINANLWYLSKGLNINASRYLGSVFQFRAEPKSVLVIY